MSLVKYYIEQCIEKSKRANDRAILAIKSIGDKLREQSLNDLTWINSPDFLPLVNPEKLKEEAITVMTFIK